MVGKFSLVLNDPLLISLELHREKENRAIYLKKKRKISVEPI